MAIGCKREYKKFYMPEKKCAAMLIAGMALLLTACGGKAPETDTVGTAGAQDKIPAWLDKFYNGSYEYVDSTVDLETGDAVAVISGRRVSSPYVEHVKVLEPGDSLWSEAYFYGDGDGVKALLDTDSGYVEQKTQRGYPYGYGEELEFADPEKEMLGEVECDVYETEYTVDLAEKMNGDAGEEVIKEPLTAVVTQKYYVDPEKDELIRVVTDLTDQTAKTEASVLMMSQGLSAEEALEKTSGDQIQEILEIKAYDSGMSIEIPETDP